MIIVDTTVWIDYFGSITNDHTLWLQQELTRQRLGITDLILCEILQGVRDDTTFAQLREQLLTFHIFDTGGTRWAVAAAQNYRSLRKLGLTVRRTIDCMIATFCIEEGHELLHRDRDFDYFEKYLGLRVVDPQRSMGQV
jgi:predicted nucleic acid-binding protein